MMMIKSLKLISVLGCIAVACASPTAEKKGLTFEADPVGYVKQYIAGFLDTFLNTDNYEISDDIKVSKNSYRLNDASRRNVEDYEQKIEDYVKTHDVHFSLPAIGSVTVGTQNLDEDELDVKLNFGSDVQEARKSKLKKIFIPILVFVLLKAMTLVPLALGILSLKAWNALQLSFFSFVIAVGLAIFQLCKKIAVDHAAGQLSAHEAWPAQQYYAARSLTNPQENYISLDKEPQQLAYSAYT
ncbi:uncharacterized protein LOC126746300 [Anthonomus grandis grandis]|uniref:uncharacterized protein LOC126746300 n=1 Tax=Anthonomus grandis grandis TaxID=2921223 RepID=UPI00216670A9|nr:uncharacterized protein LOC126746300 [Anthonomus grandis grandis]